MCLINFFSLILIFEYKCDDRRKNVHQSKSKITKLIFVIKGIRTKFCLFNDKISFNGFAPSQNLGFPENFIYFSMKSRAILF